MDENSHSVQNFIKSHRAKLEQEKENLGMAAVHSRSVGILPQDHSAVRHRDQLRRERQAEYQAFLSQHHTTSKTNTRGEGAAISSRNETPPSLSRPSSSVGERRRALASERQQELHANFSRDRPLPPPPPYHPTSYGGKYTSSERRRLNDRSDECSRRDGLGRDRGDLSRYNNQRQQTTEEERPYHRQHVDEDFSRGSVQRRKWDDGGREGASVTRQVHFERDDPEDDIERINPRRGRNVPKHWDEEEEGLMQWAREQGKAVGSDVNSSRPPALSSNPQLRRRGGSLSAPVESVGIAGLGAGDSESAKRKKQREYAEELRAQMREKQMAKEQERVSDTHSPNYRKARNLSPPPLSRWDHNSEEEYKPTRPNREFPGRHERVHFISERGSRPDPTRHDPPPGTQYNSSESSSKRGNPPMPPYWPGMYYGGFSYPPPPNFPFPPPQNGMPYYPPPPPPSLSNPYLPTYYPPPHAGEYGPEPRRGTRREQSGLNDSLSPQGVKERGREGRLNLLPGSSGGDRGEDASKEVYRAQLMEQMREKHTNKQRERLERTEFDKKKEQEIYDPFGKGGCGAPLRDKRGQLVTDLKHMKKVNDERMIFGLPSTTPLPGEVAGGGAAGIIDDSLTEHTSPRSSYDVRRSRELQGKSLQEDYKEVLKQQMREREELKRQEKEKNSQEEKLEAERIEKELKILEENYKLEKEREKEKQHELKMKNEAMMREKEEKEREELERKREDEWQRQEALRLEAEQKKQALIDNMEHQLPQYTQVRSNSPPIPTLRKLNHQQPGPHTAPYSNQQQQQPPSPPVPALHHKQLLNNPLPQDGHDSTSNQETVNQQSAVRQEHHVRSSSPVIPALRNKQASYNSEHLHQVTRSISAHAAVPQTDHLPNTKGGVDVNVVGPSRSEHRLPQPYLSETLVPPSISDPNPSLSSLHPPQPQQPSAPMEEDKVESMLKNLRSMRQMLETERQKIPIQKQPDPTPTGINSTGTKVPTDEALNTNQNSGRPGFWKARLAGPRKSGNPPSMSKPPFVDTPQKQQQCKQRKQWQHISNESHSDITLQPSQTSPKQSTSVNRERSSAFAAGKCNTPPLWLRPQNTNLSNDRAPSVGGQSRFSIDTLDVDSMARRNEERMKRLEGILNTQARDSRSPETILSDFLMRTRDPTSNTHHVMPSSLARPVAQDSHSMVSHGGRELDCETGYQPVSTTPT